MIYISRIIFLIELTSIDYLKKNISMNFGFIFIMYIFK